MKISRLITTAVALSMGLSSVAFAQGPRGDGPRAEQRDGRQLRGGERAQDRRQDRRAEQRANHRRAERREDRSAQWRQEDRWDHRDPRWNQHWTRGAGARHDIYRGGRLPRHYRSHVYVVNDWRGHHLRQPPVGYHWVQADGDYVLAAIATGVILSILISN